MGGMNTPNVVAPVPDIGEIRYFLQHLADLRKITGAQAFTLVTSAIGAVVTAGLIVTPLNWHLLEAAFAGALISNIVHLLQTVPNTTPLAKAIIHLQETDARDAEAIDVATQVANRALDTVIEKAKAAAVVDQPVEPVTEVAKPIVAKPVLVAVVKEGPYYAKIQDR